MADIGEERRDIDLCLEWRKSWRNPLKQRDLEKGIVGFHKCMKRYQRMYKGVHNDAVK